MSRIDRERITAKADSLKIVIFLVVLLIGAVIALIIPLRPTRSELEKRELTKFPEFSTGALLDGSYLAGVDSWYSDTFPFREQLLSANSFVQNLKGVGGVMITGTITDADDIPTDGGGVIATLDDKTSENESSQPASSQTESAKNTEASSESEVKPPVNVPTQMLGPLFVAGDAAYELYGFSKATSERYAAVINYAADMLNGVANVYDIIIPNSTGVMLSEDVKKNVQTSDQKEAINYMFSVMSDKVKKVNIYDTLYAHRNEYIYFRTDHHWTQLGAYYAYTQFCAAKGITPRALESYKTEKFPGFLGTFYAESGQAPVLGSNPDVVNAYYPKATNELTYYDAAGNPNAWKVIFDVSEWNAGSKYNAFIGGDNPWAVIENPEIKDGSSCVVIKESYGNAFVPFMVDHYQYTYVLDYRYYPGYLIDFVKEKGIKDVIYINNIMATGTEARINDMIRLTKK